MGHLADAWKAWRTAMRELRQAKGQAEKARAEQVVKEAFDDLTRAIMSDELGDDEDSAAWEEIEEVDSQGD